MHFIVNIKNITSDDMLLFVLCELNEKEAREQIKNIINLFRSPEEWVYSLHGGKRGKI